MLSPGLYASVVTGGYANQPPLGACDPIPGTSASRNEMFR
jgi:hypothetical protein